MLIDCALKAILQLFKPQYFKTQEKKTLSQLCTQFLKLSPRLTLITEPSTPPLRQCLPQVSSIWNYCA